MTNSAQRRKIAQFLGFASVADIKAGRNMPTLKEAKRVAEWIWVGELAWVECESEDSALAVEKALKREWKPPLTRI
jgi:hypothetical protein